MRSKQGRQGRQGGQGRQGRGVCKSFKTAIVAIICNVCLKKGWKIKLACDYDYKLSHQIADSLKKGLSCNYSLPYVSLVAGFLFDLR
ncbi:hypothetical protein F7734_33000 [Scytonema sp. UIC 10036]|nr:hypothetical protein [Scytonema sp. UIC 10036]